MSSCHTQQVLRSSDFARAARGAAGLSIAKRPALSVEASNPNEPHVAVGAAARRDDGCSGDFSLPVVTTRGRREGSGLHHLDAWLHWRAGQVGLPGAGCEH
eukprot:SAG31_NODE_2774_length_5106_cov_5.381748_4_plen_101_part_00